MAEQLLPTPATAGEFFQHAIVMELRRLNSNVEKMISAMAEPVQAPSDEVPLKEPQSKPAHRDAKKKG